MPTINDPVTTLAVRVLDLQGNGTLLVDTRTPAQIARDAGRAYVASFAAVVPVGAAHFAQLWLGASGLYSRLVVTRVTAREQAGAAEILNCEITNALGTGGAGMVIVPNLGYASFSNPQVVAESAASITIAAGANLMMYPDIRLPVLGEWSKVFGNGGHVLLPGSGIALHTEGAGTFSGEFEFYLEA